MIRFPRAGASLLAVAALAACNPRKAEVMPLEEAMYKPPLGVERLPPEFPAGLPREPVEVAGRWWLIQARDFQIPAQQLRPVGNAGGVTFYALAWDQPPYDRLLAPVPERAGYFQDFEEVRGQTAPVTGDEVGPRYARPAAGHAPGNQHQQQQGH